MANKSAKTDRQAVIDQIRKKQKRGERRSGFMIVGVAVAIAVLIVGAAAFRPIKDWYDLRKFQDVDVSQIGAPATVCEDPTTKPANGNQEHVQPGTPLEFADAPPAFGKHYDQPDSMGRKLYTAADRPDLGTLVHNLEHGYTILWYDETAAADADQMAAIRAIASKFEGTSNLRFKFKAVPWTSADESGAKFPSGEHIAYTHWSAGGADAGSAGEQLGVFQYCSEPSGAALKDFMLKYPYLDSPEPNAM